MARREWPEGIEMARQIVERHPEVFCPVPSLGDILFVLDDEATPKSRGNPVLARTSKMPNKFIDFVYQGAKSWILEWFAANQPALSGLSRNQHLLVMAHELLHFQLVAGEGDQPDTLRLGGHDVEDFELILDRFGHRWADPAKGDVADILSPDFAWGRVGQARLDVAGATAKQRQQLVDVINSGGPIGVALQRNIEAEGPPPRNKAPN